MDRPLSISALGHKLNALAPQALNLSDFYYDARIAIGPNAADKDIAQVVVDLPRSLTAALGGPNRQFTCRFQSDELGRALVVRGKMPAGTRYEPGMDYLDEYLDRDVFALLERLITPKYQGAVYGQVEACKTPGGFIALQLVRTCGRWRIGLTDLQTKFEHISYASIEPGGVLHFVIDGDTPNERILEICAEVAEYLDLYFPGHIYVVDSTKKYAGYMLDGLGARGNYRMWIDFEAKQAAEAKM